MERKYLISESDIAKIVHIALNESSENYRDKLLDELENLLKRAEKLKGGPTSDTRWNSYYTDDDGAYELNPYFGFKESDYTRDLMRKRGVSHIWYGDPSRAERTCVTIYHYPECIRIEAKDMDEHQLEGVINYTRRKLDYLENKFAKNATNPQIEDIKDEILDICRDYLTEHNKRGYVVELEEGTRGYEHDSNHNPEPYYAIVIGKGNTRDLNQIASIGIHKDRRGTMYADLVSNLNGHYDGVEFDTDNVVDVFEYLMEMVVGK